ncbi:MAG: hypothetical protein A2527_13160 [Candidatus Lambdaproteobacteria bacterium RIFOXYD2_FULL_50_16]|uniref:Uncharacterized protein n=1 Tax=Candidatus Lambdaproteobacteria bacterium RIFOXYD2_FULL_50_16 TaxID=1817772 RepID=A0A1F6GG72_9PROT|nr:MAG: hypothetical protein A2527_13160 [Candidatus Lambdaproteobacteria bacterium RIFOXYD2_FULL_50_16]
MEIYNPYFWLLFGGFVVFMALRGRRNRKPGPQRSRPSTMRGQLLTTSLAKTTPLVCLLDEGKKYGPFFLEKTPPTLPHCPDCSCHLQDFVSDSQSWFEGKVPQGKRQTDLGDLADGDWRYYKASLILAHPETDPEIRDQFSLLAESGTADEAFKNRAQAHLRG